MRFFLSLSCLITLPAMAANLRPMATLNAPVVRLSDLFEDAGENAARVLGPSPAPGGRIVVEAAQLAAIARQFGVTWKPASTADRAVLERPGKPLPREAMMEAVQAALASAGVPAESEVEIPAPALPLIPFDSQLRPMITQLEHDSATGAFTATLAVGGPDMATIHVRLAGKVHDTTAIMVPIRRLQPGEVVRREDLRQLRVRTANSRAEFAQVPEDAIGLTPRSPLTGGAPMRMADLVRPPAVRKGENVQMLLNGGGLSLVGQAIAQDAGAPGERVRVVNPASRAMLEATVIGPGKVRISPDSLPVHLPPNAAAQWVTR